MPEPDFGDLPDPREISPQDIYGVGTKVHVRLEAAQNIKSNVEPTKKSLPSSLDLEIIECIKVAPGKCSQIVVAAVTGLGAGKPFEAESLVVKFFDPVYLDKGELTGIQGREWWDRVTIAAMHCDMEFRAYEALSELQGELIPICYGKVIFSISSDGRKAQNAHEVHGVLIQYLPVKSFVYGHEMAPDKRAEFIDKADGIHHEVL